MTADPTPATGAGQGGAREAHADEHTPACDADGCYCPDDVFWARLLGDRDPCAPGKDWAAAAFTHPEGIDL